ncbi:VOC family protein [Herbidospora mongoliensis]|uniref:VOC family protein n=1 Tax=Herbidospora mongoliensis TaxID=688067 RepID=UPI000B00E1B8|nr:VOC family protein [Herbidospora mongoliensis]
MRPTDFLTRHGAAEIPHPGGTLLEHLKRVAALLGEWGAPEEVRSAGLLHATYGTDGFAHPLLPFSDRAAVRDLIGDEAEAIVYAYASCDRNATYPDLAHFHDRFTGEVTRPDLRAFLVITAANEIDVARHNPDILARHGDGLYAFFTRNRALLDVQAWRAIQETFAIRIDRLDHFVLTVADIPRAIAFYRDVLGMDAVTFGEGRDSLHFGASKINLHQAGHEFSPHALNPAPGTADLCLITTSPPARVAARLKAHGIEIEEGPVRKTGALGPMTSLYVRDPDQNLIEVASYD